MPTPPKPSSEDQDIPAVPPPALRARYLRVSWAYLWWCLGVLGWAILCIFYFVITRNTDMIFIGAALGVLVILMVVLPTLLFGGATWHKRLGWITTLVFLFSLMFVYPFVKVIAGLWQRIADGRYSLLYFTDIIHLALGVLTLALHVWTVLITVRAVRLVRALARGDW